MVEEEKFIIKSKHPYICIAEVSPRITSCGDIFLTMIPFVLSQPFGVTHRIPFSLWSRAQRPTFHTVILASIGTRFGLHLLSYPKIGSIPHEVVAKTGAVVNEEPLFLQATGFLLQPDGRIALSVYSSGAVGRLVAADTINLLKYLQQQQRNAQ